MEVVLVGICPSDELSQWRICPRKELSWWGIVLERNCPGGELS